jgi:hypothetical protein
MLVSLEYWVVFRGFGRATLLACRELLQSDGSYHRLHNYTSITTGNPPIALCSGKTAGC